MVVVIGCARPTTAPDASTDRASARVVSSSTSVREAAAVASDAAGAGVDGGDEMGGAPLAHASLDAGGGFRAEDWEIAIGKWTFDPSGELIADGSGVSSLVYRKGLRPANFEIGVDVMFLGAESSAGILFRETGEDFYRDATFYQFEWYTRGSHHDRRLSLMKKNPYWVQIVEPKYPDAPYHAWKRLRVRAIGDHLEAFVDGDRVFDKRDATFVGPGRVGLHVFQPRPVRFRAFTLTVL